MPDGENMKRHHSNGRTLAVEGHTPGGGGRLPPIGGRHSHPPRGGWASTRGVQRPISLEYQIYPPSSPNIWYSSNWNGRALAAGPRFINIILILLSPLWRIYKLWYLWTPRCQYVALERCQVAIWDRRDKSSEYQEFRIRVCAMIHSDTSTWL